MRWYEWPILWLAFFVPSTILVAAFAQAGGPVWISPDRQQLVLILVPLGLTLLVGWVNTLLRRRRQPR